MSIILQNIFRIPYSILPSSIAAREVLQRVLYPRILSYLDMLFGVIACHYEKLLCIRGSFIIPHKIKIVGALLLHELTYKKSVFCIVCIENYHVALGT